MARPTATPPLALIIATAALLSTACFDTSSTITATPYPTRLTVDPLSFRGALSCGAPGLERYVVTLYNVTSEAPKEKQMTSSGPVACTNFASFGDTFILSANFYTATVEGYDRAVLAIGADVANGVKPIIVDATTGEEVLPKWTTTCGEVERLPEGGPDAFDDTPPYNRLRYPTLALGQSEVIMHGCLPLAAAPMVDASTGDGSSGGEDAAVDGEVPDAGIDAGDGAEPDVTEPDGSGPGEDGGGDGGIDDGGADEGGTEDAGDDGSAVKIGAAKRRASR